MYRKTLHPTDQFYSIVFQLNNKTIHITHDTKYKTSSDRDLTGIICAHTPTGSILVNVNKSPSGKTVSKNHNRQRQKISG